MRVTEEAIDLYFSQVPKRFCRVGANSRWRIIDIEQLKESKILGTAAYTGIFQLLIYSANAKPTQLITTL